MEYTIDQTAVKLGIPANKIHAHLFQIDTVKRGKEWYITDFGVSQLETKLNGGAHEEIENKTK